MRIKLLISCLAALLMFRPTSDAARIKDLTLVEGGRENQLVGYGLVVGLAGKGDSTQITFTEQSIANALQRFGINVPASTIKSNNVAAVMVTADLPPFTRPGQAIDVTVSSLGTSKSLRGGTLLLTPMKGADGQVYAIAQGNLLIAGAGASAGGSKVQVNQLNAGRISGGAIVERAVPSSISQSGVMQVELNDMDFETAERVVTALNTNFGEGTATALDGRTIAVRAPSDPAEQVGFLARIENIDVRPAQAAARVIVNARTGSIVMNQNVALQNCAVAHGNLSVVINSSPQVSQPGALSNGTTAVTQTTDISVRQENGSLKTLPAAANLSDVVKALNALGATPADLIAILQAIKAAGALRADLQII